MSTSFRSTRSKRKCTIYRIFLVVWKKTEIKIKCLCVQWNWACKKCASLSTPRKFQKSVLELNLREIWNLGLFWLKKKNYYFDIYPSALISNCQRYNHVQIQHKYHLEQREHKHKEVRPVLRQYRQWKPNLAPRDYKAKSYIWDTRPVQGKDCID